MAAHLADLLAARSRHRAWQPVPLAQPVGLDDLPTPALVVDLAAMERNLQRLADFLAERGVGLRPHFKMHKCPVIAHRQLALGAIGVCAAKVAEAEVLRGAGIERILITSPVVSDDAIARVTQLAAESEDVRVVVDHPASAARLAAAAASARIQLSVLIDLDPGLGRTGIAPGRPALELARAVSRMPGLHFSGLQQYAGQIMHEPNWEVRARRAREIAEIGLETRRMIEADGLEVQVFTGGGTGTYDIDSEIPGITDIQAGSYAFMDREYLEIPCGGPARFDAFEPALFVIASAISQPRSGLITLDAGYKALATDSVAPALRDFPQLQFRFAGDEHGVLALGEHAGNIALGDRLCLVVPHCDPTVNLYDWCYPMRDGLVSELWPIAGRGCSW